MSTNNCCENCNKECIKRVEQLENLLYWLLVNENQNHKIWMQMMNNFTDEMKQITR